jgi:hypothetical protein
MRLEKWKERKIGEGVIVIYGKRESIKIIDEGVVGEED